MRTAMLIVGAIVSSAAIVLIGVLSWLTDNWVLGVLTGIALAQFPAWVRVSFKERQDG